MKRRLSFQTAVRFLISFIGIILIVSFAFAQESTYDIAIEAYVKKDFEAAVKYLKEYVAVKPDAKAYYLLGYASYKINNFEDSARYFKEAYIIDPEFDPSTIKFEEKK